VVFVAELLEDGFGIFLVVPAGDLFAKGGGLVELLADDLDVVVGAAVSGLPVLHQEIPTVTNLLP